MVVVDQLFKMADFIACHKCNDAIYIRPLLPRNYDVPWDPKNNHFG